MSDIDLTDLALTDPEVQSFIRERSLRLITLVFDQAEDDLINGDSSAKSTAYKSMLPLLIKVAQRTEEEDSSLAMARKEGAEILRLMTATLPEYEAFENVTTEEDDFG